MITRMIMSLLFILKRSKYCKGSKGYSGQKGRKGSMVSMVSRLGLLIETFLSWIEGSIRIRSLMWDLENK